MNSKHFNMNTIGIFLEWKNLVFFSLVKQYDIFNHSKTRLSWQFWDWDIFQKALSEGYLSEIALPMLWRQHQT